MATNEELAILVQQGHREYISELWANCYKLLYSIVAKYYTAKHETFNRCGFTLEDLQQDCFFVLLKMIEAYDPNKEYKFTSYAGYQIKNYLTRSVMGYDRNTKKITKPLNVSSSIDKPIGSGDDEDLTISSTLKDETAELAFDDVLDDVYRQELHNAIEAGLQTLTETQKTVIHERFYKSNTLSGTGDTLGISPGAVRQNEGQALKALRKFNAQTKRLESFRQDLLDMAYRGVGVGNFKNNQASSVEITFERLNREMERINQTLI